MFSLLGSAVGWLFGGSNASNKTIDTIASGVDKIFYTDEEKADGRQEAFKLWIEYQKATQPQNVSRRIIAIGVTSVWVISVLTVLISLGISSEYAKEVYNLLLTVITPVFAGVTGFYFVKGMIK